MATVQGEQISISADAGTIFINDTAQVVSADLTAQNGIVRVINQVILPPSVADALGVAAPPETTMTTTTEAPAEPTIADIVIAAAGGGGFTTLLAAVQAADPAVLDLLGDPSAEVTVFAPTDAAFAASLTELGIPAEDLLANTELLTSILLDHVVHGAVPSETVLTLDGESVEILNSDQFVTITVGDEPSVTLNQGVAPLNGSGVILEEGLFDIMASNGIVHAIDKVLINEPIAGS